LVDLSIQPNSEIVLRDPRNDLPLAILTVSSIYHPDKALEAELVFGGNDKNHPSVNYLYSTAGDVYVGGNIKAISSPQHYDFVENRCK